MEVELSRISTPRHVNTHIFYCRDGTVFNYEDLLETSLRVLLYIQYMEYTLDHPSEIGKILHLKTRLNPKSLG